MTRDPPNRKHPHGTVCKVPGCCQPASTRNPARDRAEIELLREKLTRLIQDKPDKAAIVLTGWINKPGTNASSSKKKKAA